MSTVETEFWCQTVFQIAEDSIIPLPNMYPMSSQTRLVRWKMFISHTFLNCTVYRCTCTYQSYFDIFKLYLFTLIFILFTVFHSFLWKVAFSLWPWAVCYAVTVNELQCVTHITWLRLAMMQWWGGLPCIRICLQERLFI